REYNCFVPQLEAFLDKDLRLDVLKIKVRDKEMPRLDLHADDPQASFVELLARLKQISERNGTWRRVVICLDGLDELRQTDERSIVDFIPRPEQMPEGFYLLLTSRTPKECPAWLRERLEARAAREAGFATYAIDVLAEQGPYRQLLRRYFDDRLEDL